MPPFALVGDDLARIGVLADLRIGHRADGKEAQVLIGIVDDLVRRLGTTDRAADDVAGADPARFSAVAQGAGARHDEKHLLLGAMAVERAAALARRQHVVRVAQGARAQQRADARRVPFELVALRVVLQLELVEIDYVFQNQPPVRLRLTSPLDRGAAKKNAPVTGRFLRRRYLEYQ